MLDPYATVFSQGQRPYYHHSSLRMCIEDMNAAGIDWSDFEFVLCERNPFTTIPSLWKYARLNSRYQKFWQDDYDEELPLLTFAQFLDDERTWSWFEERHVLDVYTEADTSNPVFVFQIEHPRPLVRFLNERLGDNAVPEVLPMDNSSSYEPADLEDIRAVFSDKIVSARVCNLFSSSFERFNYTNPWI